MDASIDGTSSTGEEKSKVVFALIDGRWNANKWFSTEDHVDGDGRIDHRPTSTVHWRREDPSKAESFPCNYYSVPLSSANAPYPLLPNGAENEHASVAAPVTLTTATQWYEYYARRYPSRGFLERLREQHRRELEQHERREQFLAKERRKKQGGGWLLRFFFGWASAEDDDATENFGGEHEDGSESDCASETPVDEDEHRMIDHLNDDGMCRTSSPLDNDVIAHEAYSFHRFHLVSERRAICSRDSKLGGWNVVLPVRQTVGSGGGMAQEERDESVLPFLCIVGYGQIAEFPSLDEARVPTDHSERANVTLTSDWQHLLSLSSQHKTNPHAMPHDLRHCRAASIGRDCLVISWGRGDGWIVFYRRVEQQPTKQKRNQWQSRGGNSKENHLEIGWEVVAVASPSGAVIGAASDNMSPDPYNLSSAGGSDEDDQLLKENRLYDSGSLYVTDLTPLVTTNTNVPSQEQEHLNGEQQPRQSLASSFSALLAVSRLGGFVELLPLPHWIWQPQSQLPSSSQQTNLPNLTDSSKTIAFSTSQHHSDIMSMDAHRINIGGPSADFVLAVCGQSSSNSNDPSQEVVSKAATSLTLWGIMVVHDPTHQQQHSAEPRFIGNMNLKNTGPDSSLFISSLATEHWIRNSGSHLDRSSKKRKCLSLDMPACTVTTRAPLVSLRFTPSNSSNGKVLLAALDYNGGVSVVDCTEIKRFSECPKFRLVCGREATMPITFKRKSFQSEVLAYASQIEWWPQNGCASDHESFSLASYAIIENHARKPNTAILRLQQWTSQSSDDDEGSFVKDPRDTFCIPTSRHIAPSRILLLPMSTSLSFLQISTTKPNMNELSICCIRKFFEPDAIIATLLRQNNPTKALDVAQKFGMAKRFGGKVMDECRIQLWEHRWDTQALICVSDSGYVISQATKLLKHRYGQKTEHNTGLKLSLRELMTIFKEALGRCVGLKESEKDIDPHWLSSASSLLKNAIRRLGTFYLLLDHFTDVTDRPFANEQMSYFITQRFLCEFHEDSLISIASCAAAKGDIEALTVLMVRHPVSMQVCMKLLDLIPLGIDVSFYEHLLPCCPADLSDLMVDSDPHCGGGPDIISNKEKVIPIAVANSKATRAASSAVLPAETNGSSSAVLQMKYFLPKLSSNFLNSKQLFVYLSDVQLETQEHSAKSKEGTAQFFNVYMDDADKSHVIQHLLEDAGRAGNKVSSKEEVLMWFLKRALNLQKQTGQVVMMKNILKAGLIRFGFLSFGVDNGYNKKNISKFCEENQSSIPGKMIYLYSATALFCNILLDKLEEPLSDCQWSLPIAQLLSEWQNLSVIQFCSMDPSDMVPIILEKSNNATSNSILTFQRYIARFAEGKCMQPIDTTLVDTTSVTDSQKTAHLTSRLNTLGLSFCLLKVKGLRKGRKSTLQGLEDALSLCAGFASFGIHSHCRSIWSEDGILDFTENLLLSVLEMVEEKWHLITEGVITKLWFQLWSIFELLPSSTAFISSSLNWKKRQAKLHFRLVAVQLCSKWCRQGLRLPRKLWNFLLCVKETNSADQYTRDVCMAGDCVISIMCRGFCNMVTRSDIASNNDDHTSQQDVDLLFDIIADIDEFQVRFFSSGVSLSGCLGKYLFSPLLSQHSFSVLKNMLKVRSAWFSQEYMNSAILSFIRNTDKLHVAMACWERLKPFFPNLSVEVVNVKRSLEARKFMSTLKLDQVFLEQLLANHHSNNSITLLQVLTAMKPQVLLLGCEFWSDELIAPKACADASGYFISQIFASLNGETVEGVHELPPMPPMPGLVFMQLANILGLCSLTDIILVKRCMVFAALKSSLWPAAVAICYSMLCDVALSRQPTITKHSSCNSAGTSQIELCVLGCVVAVIANQSRDVQTKEEICTVAMRLFSIKGYSTLTKDTPYFVLLDTYKRLEYELLSGSPDTGQPTTGQLLKAKPVSSQARDFAGISTGGILTEYGNNFHEQNMTRFFTCSLPGLTREKSPLSCESVAGFINLTKAIFNWAVTEAFKARKNSLPPSTPVTNILMMIELGSACLLELLEYDTASLLLNQIMTDFKAKALQEKDTSPHHSIQPDISTIQSIQSRGYGWNAARRAVIMTNNQGYSAALNWAVSHFQDGDFNSPIYVLQANDGFTCIDKRLVEVTGSLLQSAERKLEDLRCLTASETAAGNLPHGENDCATEPTAMSQNRKHTVRASSLSLNLGCSQYAAQSTPNNGSLSNCLRPPNSADSMSSVEGSLNSRASVKKQIQRGKIQLGTLKLSLDERKKFAMHGKQLLAAARSRNQRVIAPPKTITTSKPAP